MTTQNLTTDQTVTTLTDEGFDQADVTAAMDSFLEADSRDMDEAGWSAEDVDVVRDQLNAK